MVRKLYGFSVGLLLTVIFTVQPTHAADVTATGWNTIGSNDCDVNTPGATIDAGANRKFVVYLTYENGTDPAITTMTVGGQAASSSAAASSTATAGDSWIYYYEWDETAIAAMSGTDLVHTDAIAGFQLACIYGTIDDTSQTAISAFIDTQVGSAGGTGDDITTTSVSGDYILVGIVSPADISSFDTWDTLTELLDSNFAEGSRHGYAGGNGGDNTTTLAWTQVTTAHWMMGSIVFDNAAVFEFSAGPTVTPATNGYTIGGTLNNMVTSATVYAAAYLPAVSAPADCDAVQTATGAVIAASDATWAEDVADTFALTEASNPPVLDIYVCAEDSAASQTAVTAFPAEVRSADTNQEFSATIPWSSLVATSPWSLKTVTTCDSTNTSDTLTNCTANENDWIVPGQRIDVSAGFADLTDIVVIAVPSSTSIQLESDATSTVTGTVTVTQVNQYGSVDAVNGDALEANSVNSAADAMTYEADGDVLCDSPCASTGSFWSVASYDLQDIGATTEDGSEWICEGCTLYVGGGPPIFDEVLPLGPTITVDYPFAWQVGQTYTDQSICTDPDSQAVTFAVREALPAGLSYSAAGAFSGTVTLPEDAGSTYTFDCTDAGGLSSPPVRITGYIIDTYTAPNVVGSAYATAVTTWLASAPWMESVGIGQASPDVCDADTLGDVVTQVPAAVAEANAYDLVSLVLSTGSVCGVGREGANFGVMKFGLGL